MLREDWTGTGTRNKNTIPARSRRKEEGERKGEMKEQTKTERMITKMEGQRELLKKKKN